MTQTTERPPTTTVSLRERAAAAYQARIDAQERDRRNRECLHFQQLQDTLIQWLANGLGIRDIPRVDLMEVAGHDGKLLPAYKVDDLTFTLHRDSPSDAYSLALMTWCRQCQEKNLWHCRNEADLGEQLRSGPCWMDAHNGVGNFDEAAS